MQHGLNVSASKMSVPNYTSWNKHGPIPGHVQHSRQPSNNPYLSGRQLLIWGGLYIPVDGNNDFSDVWKFVWRKSCPIKTEQFNWISPPNRSPNSPPNKNNWKIMENHFPRSWKKRSFVCSLDLGMLQIYPPWLWGAVAILALLMQLCLTIRLYVVSQPANSSAGATHTARETGERMFNQSASCESILDKLIYDTDFFCLIILM